MIQLIKCKMCGTKRVYTGYETRCKKCGEFSSSEKYEIIDVEEKPFTICPMCGSEQSEPTTKCQAKIKNTVTGNIEDCGFSFERAHEIANSEKEYQRQKSMHKLYEVYYENEEMAQY